MSAARLALAEFRVSDSSPRRRPWLVWLQFWILLLSSLTSPVATFGGSWFWDGSSYVWYPDYEGDSPMGDPPDPPDPGSNEPQIIEWTGGTWMIDAQPMEFTGGITYSDFVPDADGDGLPDDLDPYPYESSNNSQWFEGGTWVIHGAYQSWEGAWYSSFEPLPDHDGDGLPDDWDPYPQDGNNHSFWFAGGTFTRHDLTLALRAGYHAGTGADDNQDDFPDELDDLFLNPSAYGTLQFWAGGTFLIHGAYNTYPAAHYFAPTVSDQDGDGIPDELDAAPDDAWNGTWFHWAGGTYPVDGVVTVFPPRVYGGLFADTDGDTLPDAADPYPADPANNSEWWSGGSFPVDGLIQEFAGQWHRANAGDGDGDGIPEDVDPYPGDPNNPTIPQFTWQGGVFRIDGVEQTFQAGEYPGAWADADVDGLPDSLDSYPSDPANNSAWWTGGTFSIEPMRGTPMATAFRRTWIPIRAMHSIRLRSATLGLAGFSESTASSRHLQVAVLRGCGRMAMATRFLIRQIRSRRMRPTTRCGGSAGLGLWRG